MSMEESYTNLPTSHLLGSVPAVIAEEKGTTVQAVAGANLQIFPPTNSGGGAGVGGGGRGYQTLEGSSDFVIYLGDVITANNIAIENASLYWDRALSPTRSRNILWASVFGNHDDAPFEWPMEWFSSTGIPPLHCPATNHSSEFGGEACSFKGTSRLELMRNEIGHNSLSYSISGPQNLWPSVSNYVLQLSSNDNPELPVVFMYFFDSRGGSYPEVISAGQAEWFRQKD